MLLKEGVFFVSDIFTCPGEDDVAVTLTFSCVCSYGLSTHGFNCAAELKGTRRRRDALT